MRSATHNGQRPAWYLQLDIENFFNSIDHIILLQLLTKRLSIIATTKPQVHAELLWLCRQIIHGATATRFIGDPTLRRRVPLHKRLGALGPGKSLPIGNLTSQFFANVYLNELDQSVPVNIIISNVFLHQQLR